MHFVQCALGQKASCPLRTFVNNIFLRRSDQIGLQKFRIMSAYLYYFNFTSHRWTFKVQVSVASFIQLAAHLHAQLFICLHLESANKCLFTSAARTMQIVCIRESAPANVPPRRLFLINPPRCSQLATHRLQTAGGEQGANTLNAISTLFLRQKAPRLCSFYFLQCVMKRRKRGARETNVLH
jgi:hypothetical protein